jgi:hypothetical protein
MADELDGIRIHRLAALRKAAYRARSHCIIGAVAGLVLAIQLVWMAVQGRSITCGVIAIAALCSAIALILRAQKINRDATQSSMADPVAPPDFTDLSDGSQQAANLEHIED